MKKSLKIIGVGTRRFHQLTLEGLKAIQSAKHVLFLEIDEVDAKSFFIENEILSFESLNCGYKNSEIDFSNYHRIAERVLASIEIHSNVALLVSGHPRLGVYLTGYLEKIAAENFEFRAYEGISSFAAMTNMLERDPLEKGTVIVDANRLLLFDYKIESQLDTYIYHVCSTANPRTDFANPSANNRLDLLQECLLRVFPANHRIAFVTAALDQDGDGIVEWFALGELVSRIKNALFSVTLFIPGVKPYKIQKPVLEVIQQRLGAVK